MILQQIVSVFYHAQPHQKMRNNCFNFCVSGQTYQYPPAFGSLFLCYSKKLINLVNDKNFYFFSRPA